MPVYKHKPHALLSPFILHFSYIERQFVAPHTSFTILPDSMIEMVWSFGADCSLSLPEHTHPLPPCYVVGLLDTPLSIQAHGLVQIVRARFYPWGLFPLIERLLRPLSDRRVSGLVWVAADLYLAPPVRATSLSDNGASAVAQVQHLLLNHAGAASLQDQSTIQAAQTMLGQKGDIVIRALAQQLGVPERSLRRMFHTTMQTSPKAFARLVRFEYVRDRLWRTPDATLADIAFEAGYSDQAHMQREFRHFSQRTPRQFAAEMKHVRSLLSGEFGRNLQDA